MDNNVLLTIKSSQCYKNQEPETMELTTQGFLSAKPGVLLLSYEGSILAGMSGTKTTFEIYPTRVVLRREGEINSIMEFEVGQSNSSLYAIDEGALELTVRAQKIDNRMDEHGGCLRMVYQIVIEGLSAGDIAYEITATSL